jgi:hypothetical protein
MFLGISLSPVTVNGSETVSGDSNRVKHLLRYFQVISASSAVSLYESQKVFSALLTNTLLTGGHVGSFHPYKRHPVVENYVIARGFRTGDVCFIGHI